MVPWSDLGIIPVLARLRVITSLAKPQNQKNRTTHRTKKSEKPQSLSKKPKTKDYIDEKPQTVQDTKTEEPQCSSAQTDKPNQTLAKSAKPKIPTPPSTSCQALPRVCGLRQKRLAIEH